MVDYEKFKKVMLSIPRSKTCFGYLVMFGGDSFRIAQFCAESCLVWLKRQKLTGPMLEISSGGSFPENALGLHKMLVDRNSSLGGQPEDTLYGQFGTAGPPTFHSACDVVTNSPWVIGRIPPRPPLTRLKEFMGCFDSCNQKAMDSVWIHHRAPRLLVIRGTEIRLQLRGNKMVDHETCCALFWSMAQLDVAMYGVGNRHHWRHFIEPDFVSYVLAGVRAVDQTSVQNQFHTDRVGYDLCACRMVIIPAFVCSWVYFVWDMSSKTRHVLDPDEYVFDNLRRNADVQSTLAKLYVQLFDCFEAFYSCWPYTREGWHTATKTASVFGFTRNDSCIWSAYMASQFNGDGLENPLSKVAFRFYKECMLYNVICLRCNNAVLPAEFSYKTINMMMTGFYKKLFFWEFCPINVYTCAN